MVLTQQHADLLSYLQHQPNTPTMYVYRWCERQTVKDLIEAGKIERVNDDVANVTRLRLAGV